MLTRLFIKTHRILGTLLSILFLMWFVTGIVMIYHHYPSLMGRKALAHSSSLQSVGNMPLDSLLARQDIPLDSIVELELSATPDGGLLMVKGKSAERVMDIRSGRAIDRLSRPQLDAIAHSWNPTAVTACDSLNEIDVWLIGAYPFKEYPVYKYSFGDDKATELYLSSRTGKALQLTTSESRFWAWVGAIPHWIYIKQLRATGRQPWTDVVLWISGIGILMTLTGIIVGIRSVVIARRRGRLCPYAKPMFRWHHISGLIFGLFVLTFIFSGFMSLQKVPTSVVPYNEDYDAESFARGQEFISVSQFAAPADSLLASPGVKRLTWTVRAGIPIYKVETSSKTRLFSAADSVPVPFIVNEDICRRMANLYLAHGATYSVSLVNDYEPGYSSVRKSRMRTLPVYKVATADAYSSAFYIVPETANAVYTNNNSNLRNVLYTTLHSFNCRFFYNHPLLRESLLWLLMLGGAVVSITGVVLGYRYLRRKCHAISSHDSNK